MAGDLDYYNWVNCNKFDEYDNCIECTAGNNLYNVALHGPAKFLCCPKGYFPTYVDPYYICMDDIGNEGCDWMTGFDTSDPANETIEYLECKSCLPGYYLINHKCCQDKFGLSLQTNKCSTAYVSKL